MAKVSVGTILAHYFERVENAFYWKFSLKTPSQASRQSVDIVLLETLRKYKECGYSFV